LRSGKKRQKSKLAVQETDGGTGVVGHSEIRKRVSSKSKTEMDGKTSQSPAKKGRGKPRRRGLRRRGRRKGQRVQPSNATVQKNERRKKATVTLSIGEYCQLVKSSCPLEDLDPSEEGECFHATKIVIVRDPHDTDINIQSFNLPPDFPAIKSVGGHLIVDGMFPFSKIKKRLNKQTRGWMPLQHEC